MKKLYYDAVYGYFWCHPEKIIMAELAINKDISLNGVNSWRLNKFFDELGLVDRDISKNFEIYVNDNYRWVDFKHLEMHFDDPDTPDYTVLIYPRREYKGKEILTID